MIKLRGILSEIGEASTAPYKWKKISICSSKNTINKKQRLFIQNKTTKMKLSEFRKLIREEVRRVIKEAVTLDPNKKYYWYESYPHYMSGPIEAEAIITGKTLLALKKLYDSNADKDFDKLLKASTISTKNKKFYFTMEVFEDFWIKLTKALAANKTYGAEAEEGSFAMSPNSMEEAKKKVDKMESKYEDDYDDY